MTIKEEWTTDLTESSSDYHVILAEIYVQYFMPTLKSFSILDAPSIIDTKFSTCRLLSFMPSFYSRKRRSIDRETNIDANFLVIFDILAEADPATTSGLSTSSKEAIIVNFQLSVETVLQELVELNDEDAYTAGDTNFITEPDVIETQFENEILAAEVIMLRDEN